MKKIAFALTMFSLAFSTFASEVPGHLVEAPRIVPDAPPKSVEELKAKILKRIDHYETHLAKKKSCIQQAQTHEDLKNCRLARSGAMVAPQAAPTAPVAGN